MMCTASSMLAQVAKAGQSDRVSNLEVRKCLLGGNGRRIKLYRLRWLGRVLRMEPHRLPHRTLFLIPQTKWKKRPGCQQMTWQLETRNARVGLSRVGSSGLPGRGPKSNSTRWLDTLRNIARNRKQWRSCCHFLSGQTVWRWLFHQSVRNFCLLARMSCIFTSIPFGHPISFPFHVHVWLLLAKLW